jgi:hypothetical protein
MNVILRAGFACAAMALCASASHGFTLINVWTHPENGVRKEGPRSVLVPNAKYDQDYGTCKSELYAKGVSLNGTVSSDPGEIDKALAASEEALARSFVKTVETKTDAFEKPDAETKKKDEAHGVHLGNLSKKLGECIASKGWVHGFETKF